MSSMQSILKKLKVYSIIKNVSLSFLSDTAKRQYNESDELRKMISQMINEDSKVIGTSIMPEEFKGNIVYLMIYAQYIHGIRLLKERTM
jgi:hypothetical protein